MSDLTGDPGGEADRDRDAQGRPLNARSRDELGRPVERDDNRAMTPRTDLAEDPAQTLEQAQSLLDAGRPFTAHEVLETRWKATAGPERALWRGLAQLAVGITHAMRANETGARALLRRGADTLAPYAGSNPYDVPVDALRTWAEDSATSLDLPLQPPRLTERR